MNPHQDQIDKFKKSEQKKIELSKIKMQELASNFLLKSTTNPNSPR
jgi:hypothetical protein